MIKKTNKLILNFAVIFLTVVVAVALGALLPKIVYEARKSFSSRSYAEHVTGLPHSLTLYGTTTCAHCANARKFLNEAGIPFNDLLIDQSKTAEISYNKLEEKYVPILVSRTGLVVGFDAEKYKKLSYPGK
ncbi:glutaredoxin family protein [Pseudoduganella aquatica]|uniref:glutaredoxin family protein n=1 Tax=Pseudoduganella aquatica TaxID=2660641 RepID=UPI001E35D0AF|nr:glutaredoxin family protein [Pseudoduganella aquatica]